MRCVLCCAKGRVGNRYLHKTDTGRNRQCYIRLRGQPACKTGTVVVARNPCHMPGDVRSLHGTALCCVSSIVLMQLTNEPCRAHTAAVSLSELAASALVDVLVLSTQGSVSQACLMAGGDFDGDDAFVTWEPTIVEAITAVPVAAAAAQTDDDDAAAAVSSSTTGGNASGFTKPLKRWLSGEDAWRLWQRAVMKNNLARFSLWHAAVADERGE